MTPQSLRRGGKLKGLEGAGRRCGWRKKARWEAGEWVWLEGKHLGSSHYIQSKLGGCRTEHIWGWVWCQSSVCCVWATSPVQPPALSPGGLCDPASGTSQDSFPVIRCSSSTKLMLTPCSSAVPCFCSCHSFSWNLGWSTPFVLSSSSPC